jgi:hypothetical protein
MRNLLLLAVFVTGLAIPLAKAEDLSAELALLPKDKKYNTAVCRGLREQAKNYNDGIFQQRPETYVVAAVAPGGSVGLVAYVMYKREAFKTKVQQACMTNPPAPQPARSRRED